MSGYTRILPPTPVGRHNVESPGAWIAVLKWLNPSAFSFVIPFLIVFLIFRIYPFLLGIDISFTNARVGPRPPDYIGFENYVHIFTSSEIKRTFIVSIKYTLIVVPMTFFCGLAMAVFVDRKLPTHTFSRLVFFAPFVLAATTVAIIWNWMLQTQLGLVNVGLDAMGLPSRTAWLSEPVLVLPSIAFITTWWQVGFSMVIFLGALQGIPRDLLDAASMDGANAWQRFWRITFPLLMPASTLIITISMIEAMRMFSQVYIITQGGPSDYTTTVVYYIFQEAFSRFNQGIAAAVGVVLFLMILLITALRFVLLPDKRYY